jgi:predicted HTH transcriptional regulator
MSLQQVERLLQKREGIRLEFKKARIDLPENLFETVCAMLNREGGNILLGVADDGTVVGVDPLRVEALITNIVNHSNNPQRLDRLIEIGRIIANTPGIKVKGIQDNVNVSRETIKKDLKVLIDKGLVEYRGSLKMGGYYALFP